MSSPVSAKGSNFCRFWIAELAIEQQSVSRSRIENSSLVTQPSSDTQASASSEDVAERRGRHTHTTVATCLIFPLSGLKGKRNDGSDWAEVQATEIRVETSGE